MQPNTWCLSLASSSNVEPWPCPTSVSEASLLPAPGHSSADDIAGAAVATSRQQHEREWVRQELGHHAVPVWTEQGAVQQHRYTSNSNTVFGTPWKGL